MLRGTNDRSGQTKSGTVIILVPSLAGGSEQEVSASRKRIATIQGEIPTEVWNRLGRTLIPKLKVLMSFLSVETLKF